jgi:hypothetical protein
MIKVLWSKHDKKWTVFQLNQAPWFSAPEVTLKNCVFFVDEDSRDLIRRRSVEYGEFTARYPHASVLAQEVIKSPKPHGDWKEFSYNPFKDNFFCLTSGSGRLGRIDRAEWVHLRSDGHGEVILER